MKIHLLRHGRTLANEKGLYYGATDLPLSERGVAELHALKTTVDYPEADIFVTSGLERAMQTLSILYGKEPHRTIPDLNEFDFGDFEMKSYDELRNDPAFHAWSHGGNGVSCPNGESHDRFVERIQRGFDAIRNLAADGIVENIVVVCHGGVIGALMETLFPGEKPHYYAWVPDCGLGFTIALHPGTAIAYKSIST